MGKQRTPEITKEVRKICPAAGVKVFELVKRTRARNKEEQGDVAPLLPSRPHTPRASPGSAGLRLAGTGNRTVLGE